LVANLPPPTYGWCDMAQTDLRPRQRTRSTRYRSLTNFYTADPRRVHSRERDVGLWWREDVDGPLHRAAWVDDTGELYLVRLGPPEQGGGEVEVLANVEDGERLDRVLEGWRERCGEPRSLTWLRERLRRSGAARARVPRQPVVGKRLPRRGRVDELPVFRSDAGVAI
jgi:hypothetical protein